MIKVREYGTSGPQVVVLHGGPGAAGYMAPVARGLADAFRVLEPMQRGSGGQSLTVARHVDDLHDVVELHCPSTRPALVGHSWGAMLALVYGAAHPGRAAGFVLICSGTFDRATRDRMQAICEERMDEALRWRLAHLAEEFPDPDERLNALVNLLLPIYSYAPVVSHLNIGTCDSRAYDESWDDMIRLQESGVYPAAFARIKEPVLMLHGAVDPHPGEMIRASLAPHIPHLEYREWERCGHYPWLEKDVRDEFFAVLRGWLASTL